MRPASAWVSWLVGIAALALVVVLALHVSEAQSFAEILEQARPGWLLAALALQAGTYLAQAQVWRTVLAAAGRRLPLGAAYRLSLVKLLVDQAIPSSGLSGAVAVGGALQRRDIPAGVSTAAILVSAISYALGYAIAIAAALAIMGDRRDTHPALVLGGIAFIAVATVVAIGVLRAAGGVGLEASSRRHWPASIRRSLEFLRGADMQIAGKARVLLPATACQLAIVLLDALTMWTLVRAVGAHASMAAVFASFMFSTVLRTVSIVPAGLGAFEAASVVALHSAGLEVPVALSATLLFRGFSFWLPMIPAGLLSRGVLRPQAGASTAESPVSAEYWVRDVSSTLSQLGSTPGGLSSVEAQRRLAAWGPNTVEEESRTAAVRLLVAQFRSPLVLILLFGAGVSMFVREWTDALIILAIVLGSALLGFTQEYRASTAVEALRRRLGLEVRVLRDGVEMTVPSASVVPGDVAVLSAGNLVPADGVVLDAKDFLVSEATLTGESFPVEKRPGPVPAGTALAGRTNCVFLGTSVRSGRATVLVVKTGRSTALGAIAAKIGARPPESDFARGVRHFGHLLLRTMVLIVLLVVAANQLLERPALESMLFAVALAVGLTPELLPAIVSVTLSRGAREMAARGVIVRRLDAIENFGSIDVLCTDKTGTLTEGKITLESALDTQGAASPEVLRLAFLNAALETGIANPIDAAIIEAGNAAALQASAVRKVDEIPYDFTRKRLTIVVEESPGGEHLIITKGAFANVLAVCDVDAQLRERCQSDYQRMSSEGFRVLAVAVGRCPPKAVYGHDDEEAMTLVGFVRFLDPPKAGVGETLRELAALGITTKVISGDNRHIAAHVARQIGLDPAAMLTGEQLAAMKDEALWSLAPRTDLFVEVDPQQKERIVRALQRTGHAVGYLGDGINDAPALHAADVGITVEGAVDVARESADVVLLSRDLAVLRRGVEDGRATFANTLKYIGITTSANFGNMVSMALATPLLPFLPMAATQILLNNFISDMPSITISTDRVDPELLQSAQRWDLDEVRRFMIVFGLISTCFDVVAFFVLLKGFDADERTFQTAWFVISVLTELAVLLVLRTHARAWRSRPSTLLLATTIAAGSVALAAPYAGRASELFGFVRLPWPLLAAVVVIVLGYVAATEAAKRVFYAGAKKKIGPLASMTPQDLR